MTTILLSLTVAAQRYPVTVTPTLLPPYTLNLSELTAPASARLMATITVNDLTASNLPVRLHFKLESNDITIESIKTAAVAPLFLGGGETLVLTGSDMAQYLRLDNLDFRGYSKEQYRQTGQLPGGMWRLTIEAHHFHNHRVLSNRGTATVWVSIYDPPVLTAPRNNTEAPDNPSLPLVFSWQASKHTGGTVAVQYKLELWEMRMEGVPAQTVAASMTPIFETTTQVTSYTAIPTIMNLEPGIRYCWRVTVSDPSNQAQINKNGQSEVREFTYLHTCPAVDEVTAAVRNTQADFSWTPSLYHTHFRVEMLQEGGSSDVSDCYDSKFRLYDFPQGTTWRVRVRGECKGDLVADWSPWTDFSIDPPGTPPTNDECPDCGCDDGPAKREIENYELKELQPGDTIVNRTGRTRFIVLSAEATGDHIYSGQFYLWLELWKTKVRCDYTDLKVNTDGVILDGSWRSVHNDGLMVNPATVAENIQNIRNNVAAATYDNYIRDTVKFTYPIQTIYKDQNDNYIAILKDGTELDVTQRLSNAGHTLIEDSEGNQMAVTGDHRLMSAEQYHKTGKNSTLLKNDSQAKDKQIAASGEVIFKPSGNQQYGFDAYDASTNNYPEIYPPLEGGSYRPAYKSVAQWQQDKVKADPMSGVTFRNQMGAPYAITNGDVILRGEPQPGETPVYAHMAETDSTTKVVGKLNLLTFEPREINVCLVPVNGASLPNTQTLEKELNKIFKPAVASVKVSTHSGITIDYANGSDFVHGGSGLLTVYSDDEKAAINALTDADDDTYYLFLVSSVTKLDADGNRTIVSGYMPVGYQHGFIFEQFNVVRTYAHELSHGAFALHHTFSANTESFRADEGTTNNLMDYTRDGIALNHKQWRWMHENHGKGLFGFLADEEEGEAIFETYYVDFTTDKFRDLHEIFKGKTEITYVTPGGRFITLPIAFKPNFTGTFVKSKNKEKVIPRVPDGVLFSFCDANGNYWGAHLSEKDGNYYFLGYHKKEGDVYTNEYYTENLSSKLGTSAKVLLGLDPGCDLELYFTTCDVLNETQTDNKGDDKVPVALAIEPLGEPVYAIHSHNKSCLGELGLKFYSEHAKNITDEDLLNKIFNVAKLIDICGYNLYNDYKSFANNTNSDYWDKGVWPPEERYEILEKSLNAYTKGKDELEQLLKKYENDENKFTIIAWMLVERYYKSISVDTRHYILNKLSENAMYGNPLFGNGQEYLALKLIKTVPSEDAGKLVDLLKGDKTLENLYKRIDDEGGKDNFTTFILMLSELALHTDNPNVNVDNIYIWDDSFINRNDINYKIGFQEDGNLYINLFKTIYVQGDGIYTAVDVLDEEKSLKDVDPFTWIPVRYRGESQYLPQKGPTIGNVTFVPAIYLMALQTKHLTAVTIAAVQTSVEVVTLFIGIGEIKAAATVAAKVIKIVDAIATAVDIAITWSENDIIKLQGGQEFLKGYSVFSALMGAVTFGADNIIKNNTKGVTDFLNSWTSLCEKYSDDVEKSKELVKAIGGSDNLGKIENNANIAFDILKNENVDINGFAKLKDIQAKIAKNAGIEWIEYLGKNIDDLPVPPDGYKFFHRNGKKFISRKNASDVNTPQLTVKDGKIVLKNKKAIESYNKTLNRFENLANNKEELLSALKKKIYDLPDEGQQFIDDFADASDDVLSKFIDNPKLVDAWDEIRTANPEVSKNIGALESKAAQNGSRPNPRTYLGDKFVDDHLAKFEDEGCAFVVIKDDIESLDYNSLPPNKFVALKSDMDKIITECKGNRQLLAEKLGYKNKNVFDNKEIFVVYTKGNSRFKFDIPTGNEVGANDMWIPGGKTSGGTTEAVLVGSENVIHNRDWNTFISFFDDVEPIK